VSIPGESRRKTIVIADVGVGPTCQQGKEEGERTGSEEKEAGPWAIFGCGLISAPGPFFCFFFSFPFSFLIFISNLLQNSSKLIQTNFRICKNFPLLS
jgi:hypothetical protein